MLSCLSPAKLNLFLHVMARRTDGYHDIATAFARLNWGDRIHFTPRSDSEIRITGCGTIATQDNLIYKAATALLASVSQSQATSCGADIRVHKRIPMGAGLGGGSSNAATTLLALNRLWQCALTPSQLATIGTRLGADVGFFLQPSCYALGFGVGDTLHPVRAPGLWHLVLLTNLHSSTSCLYAHPRLPRRTRYTPLVARMHALGSMPLADVARCNNDFTQPLMESYTMRRAMTILHQLPDDLRRNCVLPPRVSGSGSSVFISFSQFFWACRAYSHVRSHLNSAIIQCFLARSSASFLTKAGNKKAPIGV